MPLPPEVLRSRLKHEIEDSQRQLQHHIEVSDPYVKTFPVILTVSMIRIPGPEWNGDRVVTRQVHRFQVIVTEDYPYERPIVKWQSPIFHPNIMSPEDGGYVCTKLLDRWEFKSNLMTFIRAVEVLLTHPNPDSPFASDSCTRASIYFRNHRYAPPSVKPVAPPPKIIKGD